jgi:hypothetical protein
MLAGAKIDKVGIRIMNWDAIGAIGELVGAAAVFITLVYLTLQIRQNTNSNIGATELAVTEQVISWQMRVTDDEELRAIWDKAAANEQMTNTEKVRFLWLINEVFTLHESSFRLYRRKLIAHDNWEKYLIALLGLLSMNDITMEWWKSRTALFSSVFVEYIDEQLLERGTQAWRPTRIEDV